MTGESAGLNGLEKAKNETKDILVDAGDITLDIIKSDLTKDFSFLGDVPVVKWLFAANQVRTGIQGYFFAKKYQKFIGPIREGFSADDWKSPKIEEIFESREKLQSIVEESLIALDRYQTETKAMLLGRLFEKTFKERIFSIDEYNTILFSLEMMHPYTGIKCLEKYYAYNKQVMSIPEGDTKTKLLIEISNADYSPLATSSFLILPKGGSYLGSYGGASINSLGTKFYENIISVL